MKYLLYTRKSTEELERQKLSLESQKDRALEEFGDLDIEVLPPESASAFKPYNRPIFDEMMKRVRAGEVHGIIAWHPDRLSRNEIDAAAITYAVRTGELKDLKFCSFHFENSPEGIQQLQNSMSYSQYSSAKLSVDVKRGYQTKLKLGWKPGVAGAGYLNAGDIKGSKTIEPDTERFPLIERAIRMVLTGRHSPPKVLNVLNNEWGFKTRVSRNGKSGGKPLSRSAFYNILTDPFYCGWFRHNGELYKGSHQPMITEAEFDRLQAILGRDGKPRPKAQEFAFRGLMSCGECGCAITAERKTKLIKSTGAVQTYVYYHCTHKRQCTQKNSISEGAINEQVNDLLSTITIQPEFRDWALDVLRKNHETEVRSRSAIQAAQSKAVVAKQKEVDTLTSMRLRDLITDEEYVEKREQLTAELRVLKDAEHDTEARADKWLELTEEAFDFATNARSIFSTGTDEQRRSVFTAMGGGVVLLNGKLDVKLHPWFTPIQQKYPSIERAFDMVRTDISTGSKELITANSDLSSKWLRGLDSNQRPSG